MIIVKITGGIGNQMFQYAIGRKLSLKNSTKLLLDTSVFESHPYREYQLNQFNIDAEVAREKDKNKILKKLPPIIRRLDWELQKRFSWYTRLFLEPFLTHYYPFVLGATKNSYLQGWWQSFKYFDDIRETLLKDFTLKNPLNNSSEKILKKINSCELSISLHVRRGDYVNIPEVILTPYSFYKNALSHFKKQFTNFSLFIFSDDIAWTKSNFLFDCPVFYVDSNLDRPVEDLILMSYCKHNIIANSTFSWWAAYLNKNPGKIIFAPEGWHSDIERNRKTVDLIPPGWIRL